MRYEFAWVDPRIVKALRYPRLRSNASDQFQPTIQYIRMDRVIELPSSDQSSTDPNREVAQYISVMPRILHIRFYGMKQYTFEVGNSALNSSAMRGAIPFIRYDLIEAPVGASMNWKPMAVSHYRKNKKEHDQWRDGDIVNFPEGYYDEGDPYAVESYNIRTGAATRSDGGQVWIHSRGDGVMSPESIRNAHGLSAQHKAFSSFKNWPTWEMREAYLDLVKRNREG